METPSSMKLSMRRVASDREHGYSTVFLELAANSNNLRDIARPLAERSESFS